MVNLRHLYSSVEILRKEKYGLDEQMRDLDQLASAIASLHITLREFDEALATRLILDGSP